MKSIVAWGAIVAVTLASTGAGAQDKAAALKELAPTGKLRLGLATGAVMGAGNVIVDAATKQPRGVAVDLGNALAKKLGIEVTYVFYPNSGALTNAADGNAWDVAFIPVDAERKQKLAFGPAHIELKGAYLLAPGSKIQSLADIDKPGVRVVAVENTANGRAVAAALKNTKVTFVKTGSELFESLKSGQADAIVQSRESLLSQSTRLPGSRVLVGNFLNSFVAIAVPKGRPAALAYASAFLEEAKAAGSVRQALDNAGLKSSVVAAAGQMP
jgi:polar amino acid transport system substrate-binding protein